MSSTDDRHLNRELLERFLDDTLETAQCRAVQRHLFTCQTCEELLLTLLPATDWSDDEVGELSFPGQADQFGQDYQGLVRRAVAGLQPGLAQHEALLGRDRTAAAGDWQVIAAAAPEERRELILESPRFHRWGLFELLMESALKAGAPAGSRPQDREAPRQARDLFALALAVAERLDGATYGASSVAAARARAWAHLGDARRILADFDGAEEAFAAAESHLAQSWLDPLDEALTLELKARLRRAQSRFDESLALLDEAIALYREVNEPQLQGRSLIAKGLVGIDTRETAQAAEHLENGLFLIDSALEPRLVVVAQQSLIYCLHENGRAEEAWELIADARLLCRRLGSRLDLVRLRWLEGRVTAGLGRLAEAEAAFGEARAALLADGMFHDVALVSLDLASLYARDGRSEETRRLALELVPIFEDADLQHEAQTALLLLQRVAGMEPVTPTLLAEVAAYLESARGEAANRIP